MKKLFFIIILTLLITGCKMVSFTVEFGDDLLEGSVETEETEDPQ